MDYVRQHRLHVHVGDLSTWENFRRITEVSQSASWLHEEYRRICMQRMDKDTGGVSGDMKESVHFIWCNDAREGLQQLEIPVRRDVNLIRQLLSSSSDDMGSSIGSETDAASSDMDSRSGCSNKPRSKKREITNHQRFMQIKRNLERVQKRRRLSSASRR